MANYKAPHRRYNPLLGEWILVSPHRTSRPWQGKTEQTAPATRPIYNPQCYLCPGNVRAGGKTNPSYTSTLLFDNDFAALLPDKVESVSSNNPLFQLHTERGQCRVICFSPRHDLTLPQMAHKDIVGVVQIWIDEYKHQGEKDFINYVQIFENRGDAMGCSNPHPHGQIWCNQTIPQIPATETAMQATYQKDHGSCMLCDYVKQEVEKKTRIIFENEYFVTLVPFWAIWPFETMICPKKHYTDISQLDKSAITSLADALKRMGTRYDNLFSVNFPYSMGIHQKPTDGLPHNEWHFHLHYYPPLLRSATVRKFMVGYEMLAQAQRDIAPEQSADQLRACSEVHFLSGS